MISAAATRYGNRFPWITPTRLILSFVLLVGLGFRLHGIGFGFPYIYGFSELAVVQSGYEIHRAGFGTDEPQFVHSALRILANRSLNPEFFDHPGTPLIYMGAALYLGIFGFGLLTGFFNSTDDFEAAITNNPALFYLSGRLLVAFLGVLTVLLIYLIGKRLFNRRVGLIAAAILAISPMEIFLSKLFRVDILMGVFILIAFWFCLDIIHKKTWRSYILAGLFTGLATVSKYPAIIFAPTILVAHLVSRPHTRNDHLKLVTAGFATIIGAFIGSPYVFLDYPSVIASLSEEVGPRLGGTGQGFFLNLIWYLREAFPVSISVIGLILSGIGFVLSLLSRQKEKLVLVSFPVIFLIFIALLTPRWERWILPVIPFFILLTAYTLFEIHRWLGKRINTPVGVASAVILSAVIFIPMLQLNVLHGKTLIGEDTRTTARKWMVENIPAGSRVLMELNTPQTPIDLYQYYGVHDEVVVPVDLTAQRHNDIIMQGRLGWIQNLDQIEQHGIDYIVMSDYVERYASEHLTYPDEVAVYNQLMSMGKLIYEHEAQAGRNQGPHIRIYEVAEQ